MTDPIGDIESRKANHDTGIMLAQVFDGALEESPGDYVKAFLVAAAYFTAIIRSGQDPKEES